MGGGGVVSFSPFSLNSNVSSNLNEPPQKAGELEMRETGDREACGGNGE